MGNLNINVKEKIFLKNKELVTRKITGELFIVPVRGKLADMQRIFTLNPVAEFIWNSLDGKTNIGNIRQSILSNYEVNEQAVDSDILDFIKELLEADLIRE